MLSSNFNCDVYTRHETPTSSSVTSVRRKTRTMWRRTTVISPQYRKSSQLYCTRVFTNIHETLHKHILLDENVGLHTRILNNTNYPHASKLVKVLQHNTNTPTWTQKHSVILLLQKHCSATVLPILPNELVWHLSSVISLCVYNRSFS